ncbi:hypothetical protein TPA0907_02640 [Micromonospora humidisoli]|uniref:hypothetical protein n=1 Tax=Micromonospora sp. AKA109 TaxID=2733865 RepID=UPI0022BF0083|nr:hypothetical protein [Micromonospora sp. AKA109]GHJ05897.1 hypothetical protein TPA0907_02640 [Micromonospora sp. AKA109]
MARSRASFLSYNDFHGAIDPPGGSGATVNGTPAGGVEYLATWLKKLRAEAKAEGRVTTTVGAGDLIGATPLVSAAFHDEPTIELMNQVGLDVSSVGNHEFDEGVKELLRIGQGRLPPGRRLPGRRRLRRREVHLPGRQHHQQEDQAADPAPDRREVRRRRAGRLRRVTLEGTPGIVNPAGIKDVTFTDEVQTANKWGGLLKLFGVKAMVLLVHEGGAQSAPPATRASPTAPTSPARSSTSSRACGRSSAWWSPDTPTASTPARCRNSSGKPSVVTSAGNNGQLVTDIDYSLNRRTGRFTSITREERDRGERRAQRRRDLAADGGVVRQEPALVDAGAKTLADKYRTAVAPIANRVVGKISADIVPGRPAQRGEPAG